MDNRFHLDRVLEPDFQMLHGPEIERVAFVSVTLIPAAKNELVVLKFLADVPMTAAQLQQRIAALRLPSGTSVHHAGLEFRLARQTLESEGQKIRCELTAPDRHNLTDAPYRNLIWQLLLRWGVYGGEPYAAPVRSAPAR